MTTSRLRAVVDDEARSRRLRMILEFAGYRVDEAGRRPAALTAWRAPPYALLLDIKIPIWRADLLKACAAGYENAGLMISGTPTSAAVEHPPRPYDFFESRAPRERGAVAPAHAGRRLAPVSEHRVLRHSRRADRKPRPPGAAARDIDKARPPRHGLTGRSGTASSVARASPPVLRRERTLVPVNCAAIPDELIESECSSTKGELHRRGPARRQVAPPTAAPSSSRDRANVRPDQAKVLRSCRAAS